ncbi:hypothetical protein [Ralstonia phage phiRSL1]|uniref:Uncharacterized protein n=1 Tax=Ralstonia phage phiRSL1 TaxID=1980924 RepID=B2ZY02_9CAUD|nr:hypothetical protein RSL1_ORF143 [Ralstonia phage phiRSL1]BAG41588.1 hypothetical protein [Ralstonia phage phiRSL1]
MSTVNFPFSVPVNYYTGTGISAQLFRSEFYTNLPVTTQHVVAVATTDTGTAPAGLYLFQGQTWQLAIPYDNLNDFIIAGVWSVH